MTRLIARFFHCMIFVLPLSGLQWSSTVTAATTNLDGDGRLTGVSGLAFMGETWEVTLFDGTCVAGFSGCDSVADDFAFSTQGTAEAAMTAFLGVIATDFLNAPDGISGCPTTSNCYFNLPFALKPGNAVVGPSVDVTIGTAGAGFLGLYPLQPGNWGITADLAGSSQNVYLQFTTAAPVPLPATLPLFASAVGMLAWRGRRRSRGLLAH